MRTSLTRWLTVLVLVGLVVLLPTAAFAQLGAGQRTALRTGLLAATDPTVTQALAVGDDSTIASWCNGLSATDAWMAAASRRTLFEASNITQFDGLSAGKRDAWTLLLDNAPLDFGRNALRTAVVDIWGASNSVAVLQALREKARRCEAIIGGTVRTTNTVSALDRSYFGTFSPDVIAEALRGQ